MKHFSSFVLVALGSLAAACAGGATQPPPASPDADAPARADAAPAAMPNIVQTAAAAGSFSTLVAALKAAGLDETLSGPGPFTVFAPTDEAFKKLPAGTVESLLKPENKDKLVAILTYHVVSGNVMAKDVLTKKSLKSVQGQELSVVANGSEVHISGALLTKADIVASNGVIHVIDSVVLPK